MATELTKIQRMTLEAAIEAGPSSSAAEIYLHLPEGSAAFVTVYFAIDKLAQRGLLVADDSPEVPRRWTSTVDKKVDGPSPLAYIVCWGGAILAAWAALRWQQVNFGWRTGSRHSCGYVDRDRSFNAILGCTCQRCGGDPKSWENIAWKSKFFGGIEVSSGKDKP